MSHTRHLSVIEDICYRRLLDWYYLHEQPLTLDVKHLTRHILLSEYQEQVQSILDEFFEKTEAGYINHRADKEIKQYQSFAEAGKRGAAKRWGKDSPPNNPPNPPLIANNKHKPLNNNQYTGWRNSDTKVLEKAKTLGLHTQGKTRYEILEAIDKKEGKV